MRSSIEVRALVMAVSPSGTSNATKVAVPEDCRAVIAHCTTALNASAVVTILRHRQYAQGAGSFQHTNRDCRWASTRDVRPPVCGVADALEVRTPAGVFHVLRCGLRRRAYVAVGVLSR